MAKIAKLEDKFKATIGDAAQDAANMGRSRIAAQTGFKIGDFSGQYAKLIRDHAFEASARTMERMTGDVMVNLAKSYEEGLGIDKAAERLTGKFESMKDYELERIARTEIQSHQNEGSHLTLVEQGVEYEMWWSADDIRVRGNEPEDTADHIILHGQIVRTGDNFSNGLLYPGDRNGPIEEWINCRCRLVSFIMPEGYMAPPGKNYFYEGDLVKIAA